MPETKPDPAFAGFRLFRIDSSGWAAVPWASAFGRPVFANARGDVWEICLPDGTREQFFTYRAAVRELGAAWLRLPAAAELEAAATAFSGRSDEERVVFRRSLSGFRHSAHGAFYDQRANAYRWADGGQASWKWPTTFRSVRNGADGASPIRLPSGCAAPVAVAA